MTMLTHETNIVNMVNLHVSVVISFQTLDTGTLCTPCTSWNSELILAGLQSMAVLNLTEMTIVTLPVVVLRRTATRRGIGANV